MQFTFYQRFVRKKWNIMPKEFPRVHIPLIQVLLFQNFVSYLELVYSIKGLDSAQLIQ